MKEILLIGLGFYNYEDKIKNCLERKDYKVTLVYDTPKCDTALQRILTKEKRIYILSAYQRKILQQYNIQDYDYIIVIVGRFLQPFFLDKIKEKKKKSAVLILYLWDDVARVQNFNEVSFYYDKIFSFDPKDCQNFGFSFLPLFYTDEFHIENQRKLFDVYSAVFDHSDRLKIIQELITKNRHKNFFFIITQGKIGYIRNIQNHNTYSGKIKYKWTPVSKDENLKHMVRAKGILDIQIPSQVGLTIRSIEALGSGIKLLTTNQSIRNYDFYNPQNILLIDRKHPQIDWRILDSPYEQVNDRIYNKYSLDNWIDVVLGNTICDYLIPQNEFGL